ncbi:three-helix bundle dimerization domain-containing protein [Terrabacter sp. BE26]|uniref:three-helix bundle dimerization domain-containing protein n=1 Tax=Terrabacter sp. BE26 TaxID=2898152 RepID=UPI0035BE31D5
MDRAAEREALAEVQARLEKGFPELHPDVIAAAVRLAHSELVGPGRDFVPVLVEHAARDRLVFALRDGDVSGDKQTSSAPTDD